MITNAKIDNPKRGCGFLKENAMYLKADVHALGNLPAFVEYENPVPYMEQHYRGYKFFNSLQWEIAVSNETFGQEAKKEWTSFMARLNESEKENGRIIKYVPSWYACLNQ